MGIILNKLNHLQSRRRPAEEGLPGYHTYGKDLSMVGFVAPLVYPQSRLEELLGNGTEAAMAARCHIDPMVLVRLLDNQQIEPTVHQLVAISRAYNVSVMWLLGYHTAMERKPLDGRDQALIAAITSRNEAERTLQQPPGGRLTRQIYINMAQKRVDKYSRKVAEIAAEHTRQEHLPMTPNDLYLYRGMPVSVESAGGERAWGIVRETDIVTATTKFPIEDAGTSYRAFLMPAF